MSNRRRKHISSTDEDEDANDKENERPSSSQIEHSRDSDSVHGYSFYLIAYI